VEKHQDTYVDFTSVVQQCLHCYEHDAQRLRDRLRGAKKEPAVRPETSVAPPTSPRQDLPG
jgi:hypothetical protein